MSPETISVKYLLGPAAVVIETGDRVERGAPVSVPLPIGQRLLEQGWVSGSDPKTPEQAEAELAKANEASAEQAEAASPDAEAQAKADAERAETAKAEVQPREQAEADAQQAERDKRGKR